MGSPPTPPHDQLTTEARAGNETLGATSVEILLGTSRAVMDVEAQGDIVLGRSSEATLVVDDERVSRRHLRIAAREGLLFVTDLGSRNGSLVNGRRLEGERRLRGGDELEVGPVRIRVGGQRLAGLLDEGDLIDRLDEEIERATIYRRPLSVVGFSFDGPLRAVDDAVTRLLGRVGRTASVGEYAPRRILVILPERPLAAAEEDLESWCELSAEIADVSVAASAAGLPEDGVSADELIAAAFGRPQARGSEPARALVAEDPRSREVFDTARRVARSLASVLVTGETGAGKEWVASEIHRASPRGGGPFVRVNCAALPETLVEAELFGHEKGAFTGADRRRIGRLESASGGTIFLDEIGELPMPMQAKLLHVLEDRSIVRVGANDAHPIDVRFVAATNRDLEGEIRAGRFRDDLYFRLSAITIHMPPLRERPLDLAALADHFLAESARAAGRRTPRMSAGFRAALGSYPWPGNVRELRNVIERAVVLSDGDELGPRELPDRLRISDASPAAAGPMRQRLDDVERANLEAALAETAGNRTHAARKLGISRRTLIYKLQKAGLAAKG